MRPETEQDLRNEHCPYVKDSLFYHRVLHIHLSKDYVFTQANLDNYDGLLQTLKNIYKTCEAS